MTLATAQIIKLRAKVHALKPVVMIGNNGLTANVHQEINQALEAHELIKIRINNKDKEFRKQAAAEICAQHQAALIQTIGHIIAIYRRRKETA